MKFEKNAEIRTSTYTYLSAAYNQTGVQKMFSDAFISYFALAISIKIVTKVAQASRILLDVKLSSSFMCNIFLLFK